MENKIKIKIKNKKKNKKKLSLLLLALTLYCFWIIVHLREPCYNQCLLDAMEARVEGNDNMIGYAAIVSVSTSYSRHLILASSSCCMTWLPYVH